MEIKIKSTENGWVTDRQMTLPDDRKLTDAILRTVRRYQRNQEKAASEKDSQDASTATAVHAPPDPTEEDSTADVPAVPTVQVPDEEKDSSGKVGDGQKEKGYRGFLLVKCAGCGKLFSPMPGMAP